MGEQSVKKVLVVEDNPDNRKILVYRLRRLGGFSIEEAENGLEAMEVIRSCPPDLIIMDINMPHMDGLEVTRAVRAMDGPISKLPILLLTAQVSDNYAELGFAAGCTDYLPKPIVDPKVLEDKIHACLYGSDRQPSQAPPPQSPPA